MRKWIKSIKKDFIVYKQIILSRYKEYKQKKKFKQQVKKRGWADDETWSLNSEIMRWIISRCTRYLELADKVIDLSYHKYEYQDRVYTEKEAIQLMIAEAKNYLMSFEDMEPIKSREEHSKVVFDLLKLVFEDLWW